MEIFAHIFTCSGRLEPSLGLSAFDAEYIVVNDDGLFLACDKKKFCSCIYVCPYGPFYGPFNCISFHKFSRQLSVLSFCSSGLISALLVLSTVYLFMKVSLSPDIIHSG